MVNIMRNNVVKCTDFFAMLAIPCKVTCVSFQLSEYLATAASDQEFDNLFDNFDGGMCVDPGKTLLYPLNDNSLHIVDHWTKASMGLNTRVSQ
jgi:hypothetical protein